MNNKTPFNHNFCSNEAQWQGNVPLFSNSSVITKALMNAMTTKRFLSLSKIKYYTEDKETIQIQKIKKKNKIK